ncbi:MAG: class I SAM-dependent methyltransferase [Pelagibacteraceae bacterium]
MITRLQEKYKLSLSNDNKDIYNATRVFETFNSIIKEFYNEDFKNKKVLDLGEGDGSFLSVLKTNQIKGEGLDIEKVDFEKDRFPIEDSSIDIITSNSVVEHLKDVSNFFNESRRVLKKDGIMILVTPNFKYSYQNFYDDSTHVNPFTPIKLNETLNLFNFKKNKVLPWLVKKNPKIWRLPFAFFYARYLLIARNDTKIPLPSFLKGKSDVMISISKK